MKIIYIILVRQFFYHELTIVTGKTAYIKNIKNIKKGLEFSFKKFEDVGLSFLLFKENLFIKI